MRIPFILTTTDQSKTLMVAVAGQPHVVAEDHLRFAELVELVSTELDPADLADTEAKVLELVNTVPDAVQAMRSLSDRVGFHGGTLFFDGDPVDGALAEHIVAMIRQDDDNWIAPVRFLENLMTNPAKHVRRRLFKWVSDRGMTITRDGLLIGYKGVADDERNSSITAGSNTVWVNGVPHTGHIPNPVGGTLTMPRSQVDDDRDAGCSQGLHVGTFEYARDFTSSEFVLVVEFNPRDVVAIPKDSEYSKIRVCRYTVLDKTSVKDARTTWSADAVEPEEETLCHGCGEETEDGEPTCDECLAADEDETH